MIVDMSIRNIARSFSAFSSASASDSAFTYWGEAILTRSSEPS